MAYPHGPCTRGIVPLSLIPRSLLFTATTRYEGQNNLTDGRKGVGNPSRIN